MGAVHERAALIARVREDISNAEANEFDILAPGIMTDKEIADDLRDCTTGYEDVPEDELIAVIAAVRKERVA